MGSSPNTILPSFSPADFIGFVFYCLVLLNWAARIQKFYARLLPLLHPMVDFFVDESRTEDCCKNTCWKLKPVEVKKTHEQEEDGGDRTRLSRDELEMVLSKVGMACDGEGEKLKDFMGSDEISSMFEEEEPSPEEMEEAFCVFDQNGDGFIDGKELQRVLSLLGFREESSSLERCEGMISSFDENRDGRIDFHEFVKFMECGFC